MNKKRKKAIKESCAKLLDIKEEISDIQSDEQEAYDNIPEGLLESESAERSGEAIDAMEEAIDYIETAIETLKEIL